MGHPSFVMSNSFTNQVQPDALLVHVDMVTHSLTVRPVVVFTL